MHMTESPGESVRSVRRDNRGAPPLAMAEPATRKAQKNRLDPLTAAAVVFFLLAVAFAAAPAINAGSATLAGLMLLIGLAGVACLGLFVLRGSADPATEGEQPAEKLIEAPTEPAAIA